MLAALLIPGVILGLITAWAHSLAYLGSRWFTVRKRGTSLQLLVIAHFQLGLVALVGMPLTWPSGLVWPWEAGDASGAWLGPAAAGGVVLGVAQASLFAALRYTDASTVSPLLTLKLITLGLATNFGIYSQPLPISVWGWLAIGLAITGAVMIQGVGKPPPLRVWPFIGITILGYSFVDLSIVRAINAICEQGYGLASAGDASTGQRIAAGVFIATVLYAVTGFTALLLLPWFGSRRVGVWRDALAYAGPWAVAMVTLYGTFALLGAVFGSVLQGTRALWSVLMGAWLGKVGDGTIETDHHRHVIAWRVLAAACMVTAVALFGWMR
ncbi:MAG: hypothetical protein AAGF84_09950 [Planctomycetota bacterium]